ncbi:putative hydrolase of the HAD superfamily [Paenibacillus sp. BK033]|uniref:HAD family hydrolase n=1 Tax=Paenibacillus sp. BK033 TaxID=2512133 RepID=UPI0010447CEA|nr:HAD family hydrolase [Paenibacillus sp. BK033]TCN01390.1 putative hydrolase of the HAD superfamily [Paenibacillus sp. BK033]
MRIKAVLFDLDGTLLDRDASLALFIDDQYERYPAFQKVAKDIFAKRFIELDQHGYVWKDKVYQQLLAEFQIPGLRWEELLDDYLKSFQQHCVGFPHLIEMLSSIKSRGIKIALISNGYGQFQYDNFKALGISPFFDEVLISEWEGLRKPDPAIFQRALDKLGVKAKDAVFVGDHPDSDIRGSRAVGMKAVWKYNPYFSPDVEADGVIHDLDELLKFVFPAAGLSFK